MSADGRFVAFASHAPDLVPNQVDVPPTAVINADVFLYDRVEDSNILVSHVPGSAFEAADGTSTPVGISEDGRYVLFVSTATNLIAGHADGNGLRDLFLFDRETGINALVSHASGSAETPGDRGIDHVLSSGFSLSKNGRFVVFVSTSTNLVSGQIDNQSEPSAGQDVFLYDRESGSVSLVSHSQASAIATGNDRVFNSLRSGPRISADGTSVLFSSYATDHVPGVTDMNGTPDVFLYDIASGAIHLVTNSVGTAKAANEESIAEDISADGRFVAFVSSATDLVADQVDPTNSADVFLYDHLSGLKTLVSHESNTATKGGNRGAGILSLSGGTVRLSGDGRYVAYWSESTDLVAGMLGNGPNVFIYDRPSGENRLVSHAFDSETTGHGLVDIHLLATFSLDMSEDGRYVTFSSDASDLVEGFVDGNPLWSEDAYLWDGSSGRVMLLSRSGWSSVTSGNGATYGASLSADGNWVTFDTNATDLTAEGSGVHLLGPMASLGFYTVTPCRVADTRGPSGPHGGPALEWSVVRTFRFRDVCDIPSAAVSVVATFTVVSPSARGHLRIFPAGQFVPPTSGLSFDVGQTRGAQSVVTLGAGNGVSVLPVLAAPAVVDLVIDVVGYYQ